MGKYKTVSLDSVSSFINKLPLPYQAKIQSSFICMEEGDFNSVYIKSLRGKIKELLVDRYRFIFFIKGGIIYFIGSFIKKSRKTPKVEIINAENIFKLIK